ncbi:hypothetical protein OU789_12830 [Halocynthiibacter sp. C4]|uniref:hypothetical protein n=1 Tax=Halocynthiibacter sp. C4 TaxID=2992758 RepID=UPI00237C3B0D|nr:hypothetical protein [Halocynthiibacter sp. C4]MDE0590815.1 hypothetical protein [Halocynthiibacter sp. C4]
MTKAPDHQTVEHNAAPQKRDSAGLDRAEVIALALSAVWLLGLGSFVLFAGDGLAISELTAAQFVMVLVAIFLPVAVIWVGALAVRSARVVRDETARLQAAIDALRQSYVAQQTEAAIANDPSVKDTLDQIVTAQRMTETAIATFATSRPQNEQPKTLSAPATSTPIVDDQTALALGTRAEDIAPPLSTEDFIRAVNFPENADDAEGFAALRRALKDRQASRLIQSAQDILTLLSQDGIYMDDLRPDRARPEIWRQFAKGERGRTVAALGGIRDRSCLALTAGRMRQDPIFRDTVHHFLRQFDQTFTLFEAEASDQDIAEMADTRTARAFMLLGRVTGTFD